MHATHPTVDAAWIGEHLDDDAVRLIEVDVAPTAYREGHIPGAGLWNVYADLRHPDHTPLGRPALERQLSRSGIAPETTVVFYGYGAHLGYWLLQSHGHADVRLLDGPRERWTAAGNRWSREEPAPRAAAYRLAPPDERMSVSREATLAAIGQPGTVLLDVRSRPEYTGERFWPSGATEDAGRAGRIPGAVHLPIDELRNEDGSFRRREELLAALRARGLSRGQRIIAYCTVGNRAGQAWFALTHLLGYRDVGVYQGSWAEWGHLPDTPVET